MNSKPWMRAYALSLSCVAGLLLAACSARTPNNLASVPVSGDSAVSQVSGAVPLGERFDAAAETEIATEALRAWRLAVAHTDKPAEQSQPAWQKQRDSDEKAALDALQALSSRYPHSSTVFMMMGQVENHFGKHQQAIDFYNQAREKNVVNPVTLFKLAESEKALGKTKEAAAHYRELLQMQPDFYAGKLGLAECLAKEKPAQAQQLAQEVLDAKPDDPDAIKKARQIVSETKGGK